MDQQLLCFGVGVKWLFGTFSVKEVKQEHTCVDDERVEHEKEGDGGPSVVLAPVEVDAGEQVAARQQGVDHPEGEIL